MNSRGRKMLQLAQISEEENRENYLPRKEPPKKYPEKDISCTGSENDADTDNAVYTEQSCHKNTSIAVNDTETSCVENTNYVAFDEPPKPLNDNMPNIDSSTPRSKLSLIVKIPYTEHLNLNSTSKMSAVKKSVDPVHYNNQDDSVTEFGNNAVCYQLDLPNRNLDSPPILDNETTSLDNTGKGLLSESNSLQSTEDCNDFTKRSSREHEEDDSTLVKPPNKEQQDLLSDDSTGIRDFSPDASDDEYLPKNEKIRKRRLSTSSDSSSSSNSSSSSSSLLSSSTSTSSSSPSPKKKGKKRTKNEETWKKNVNKKMRNTGKQYVSRIGKIVEARVMKPPCGPKCRLSCSNKFTNQQRQNIFDTYWELGSFQRQRDFLSSCIISVNPVYRRLKVDAEKHRKPNYTFYLVKDGQNMRVCKQFLLNTLAVSERVLRTISQSKIENSGILPADRRGKHGKQLKTDPEIVTSVRTHIDSIPRIESHYLRANTSREFIDGGLTVAELHRVYVNERKTIGKPAASYDIYSRIFNKEYNISFFIPKKDQCELCESYKNAVGDKKAKFEVEYGHHLEQKRLSRAEKKADITNSKNEDSNTIVAIYDLQAIMPAPSGDISAFFYKSKLNCLNLTVTNIKSNVTTCYFWHQALANRGAIEIGSCVYRFLEDLSKTHPNRDVILFTDNCCGQQKNRYLITMYYYAVSRLPIQSITHKFLIPGHTQNEGDNAHSVIEKAVKRAKKSGPIYVPDQYAQIIRTAKKTGHPYVVVEMDFKDFYELKTLNDEVKLNMTKSVNGDPIKITEMKMIRFTKDSDTYAYKTDYAKDWIEVQCHKTPRGSQINTNMTETVKTVSLQQAYTSKIGIDGRLKSDLQSLIENNIVPSYYARFYEELFRRDVD